MSNARQPSAAVPGEIAQRTRIQGVRVGMLLRWDERGPFVDYAGNPHGDLLARNLVQLQATCEHSTGRCGGRRAVMLAFEDGNSDQPIILAFLQPELTPVAGSGSESSSVGEPTSDNGGARVEAKDEIVLRCGAASITLRRNGRIVLRGSCIESYSRGLVRIKGAVVKVN